MPMSSLAQRTARLSRNAAVEVQVKGYSSEHGNHRIEHFLPLLFFTVGGHNTTLIASSKTVLSPMTHIWVQLRKTGKAYGR